VEQTPRRKHGTWQEFYSPGGGQLVVASRKDKTRVRFGPFCTSEVQDNERGTICNQETITIYLKRKNPGDLNLKMTLFRMSINIYAVVRIMWGSETCVMRLGESREGKGGFTGNCVRDLMIAGLRFER
jgi:hypothetical protein